MTPVEEIKQKIDVVDLVGSYVTLNKSGRNYKGVCPFHAEKSPSFMVSQELQIYKCFGCGEAGDIFSFVQKIEGIDFPEALKRLAEKAGVELPESAKDEGKSRRKLLLAINQDSARFYYYLLEKHKLGLAGAEYLKGKRGLSDDTIRHFLLGYAPDQWDLLYKFLIKKGYKQQDLVDAGVIVARKSGGGYVDKFRGRVMFPLVNVDGTIVGFTGRTIFNKDPKYLNTAETEVFHKTNYIYALDKAKISLKKEGAIFVEGQMDVISAHQSGFTNVIASSGTSLTLGQLQLLARYTKDIVFCFDADNAGFAAMHRAISLAESQGFNIRAAVIPSGVKDLDELIQKDKSEARRMFDDAVPVYDFYFVSALRKNSKKDPIGKKKIYEELLPVISSISNNVTTEHYIKKLSEELNINEEVIKKGLTKSTTEDPFESKVVVEENLKSIVKNSPEFYLLNMLIKSEPPVFNEVLESLEESDFSDNRLKELFIQLKNYVAATHNFDIQAFIGIMETNLADLAREMFLRDFGNSLSSSEVLAAELKAALARVKKDTLRRKIADITEKIRLAEMEKNSLLLEKLLSEYRDLSKKLLNL